MGKCITGFLRGFIERVLFKRVCRASQTNFSTQVYNPPRFPPWNRHRMSPPDARARHARPTAAMETGQTRFGPAQAAMRRKHLRNGPLCRPCGSWSSPRANGLNGWQGMCRMSRATGRPSTETIYCSTCRTAGRKNSLLEIEQGCSPDSGEDGHSSCFL